MPVEVIPFDQLVERASLNNPVFKAAGVNPPATPAAKPTEISFSEIQPTAPTGEISLGDVVNVDSFPRRTPEELSADEKFNPTQYYAQNPDVAKDPAQLAKLLEAYRAKREKGITSEVFGEARKNAIPIVKKVGKGVYQLASNLFQLTGLQTIANQALAGLTGETPQVKAELLKESGRQIAEAGGENIAATEEAFAGLGQLAYTGARKLSTKSILGGTTLKDKTHQELLQDLNTDVAFQKQLQEIGGGRGEFVKALGWDENELKSLGIKLEPDAVDNISLVDPATMVAFAGGFKVLGIGGRLLATVPTVAKGAELIERMGAAVPKLIGGAIGGGVKLAGKVVPPAAAVIPPAAGLVKGGPFGLITGLLAAERIAPRAAKIGAGIQNIGEQIAGNAPRSATLQTIIDAAKSPVVTSPLKGAIAGTAAAVPLAAAAEGNEQVGAILGGGLALGTVAGGVHGAKTQIGEFAATRLFDPHTIKFAPIESPAYGVDAGLDAANAKQLSKLSANERGAITTFREAFRPLGAEIYTVDKPTYVQGVADAIARQENRPATPEEVTAAQQHADTQGYFDYNRADGRRVILLNGDANAIPHEPGHLFESLLSPEKRTEIVTAVRDNYSPEQISALKARYEQRFGKPVADQYFLNELIAENFSAIFNNVPVTELTAPPGFFKKLAAVVGEGAETLGIDLTRGRTTPDLNVPVSFGLRKIFENAAREVTETQAAPGLPTPGAPAAIPAPVKTAPTPSGTAPARPAPGAPPLITPSISTAPNIRVTRGQQDAFARRAQETGITEAQSLAAKSGDTELTQRVNEVSNFIQSGNPVLEIEHRGIVSKGTPAEAAGRTARRGEQESGYAELERLRVENRANAPESVVNTHQKTFVPVRWTEQGNTPTLIAMSLDKVISNVHRIVKSSADRGAESLIPYESQQGRLTEPGWNKVMADAQAYAENQSNGFRGDGQRLTRPTGDVGLSIPAENPDYRPQPLGEAEANFQNLIQGLATPETAREIKGKIPGNVKGQILAEANIRPLEIPAGIKPKNVGKQEFKSTPGRRLQEVNPLRNELVRRGVDVRQLIEVTERIRAKDIASVTPRGDLNFKAPVTDIIRGGFLPGEEKKTPVASPGIQKLAEDYSKTSGVAYRPAAVEAKPLPSNKENFDGYVNQVASADANQFRDLAKNWGGGFTAEAWKVGREVASPEQVATLKQRQTEQETLARAALAAGDFDAATPAVFKSQFFREAWEAATGEGSAGTALRQRESGYKPPFPAGEPEGGFLPAENFSDKSDPIELSAIKTSEGKIFTGSWHGEALDKYADSLGLPKGSPEPRTEAGFVTRSGRFLNRQDAFQHAEKINQIPKTQIPKGKRGALESQDFEEVRQFLPRTAKGAKLSKEGFDFRISGSIGMRGVEVFKDGISIGEITSVQRSKTEAEISLAELNKEARGKGVGEAAYRELLTQLKDDGVKEVGGNIVAPEPLAIRRKIFGRNFKKLELNLEPVSIDDALTSLNELRRGSKDLIHVEAVNEIRPESQFLPKKKTDYSKYNVGEKKSFAPQLTGWLQPDKKFVPLPSSRHENFLAENSNTLNKKFGTKFSGTPDVEERLSALNAGFVRFRSDPRTGGVHIELNSKFWPKFKSQITDRLLSDPESVDSVNLSLLDDKGKVVDSTETGNLFSTEGPERIEKIQGAIDEIRTKTS